MFSISSNSAGVIGRPFMILDVFARLGLWILGNAGNNPISTAHFSADRR
jgi:hypothetical protein